VGCDGEEIKYDIGELKMIKPYSDEDYEKAKQQGLDLDDWNDYIKYFGIGNEPNYDDM
jgi:hypothetical protein